VVTVAPYGSWVSPITVDTLVERVVGLADPCASGAERYWVESRPNEGGRQVVVRRDAAGRVGDVLPAGFSARTLVHEYGGRCYAVTSGTVVFANFADQRIYRVDPGLAPVAVTPDTGHRYADPAVTPDGREAVWVRERHDGGEVANDLVAVPLDGSSVRVIAAGHDFYAAPRVSPDGTRIAWVAWDHPNMPWDGTTLWESAAGGTPRLVAGGSDESITQPSYSPSGVLHWMSDRTGWWNLYADDGAAGAPVMVRDADLAGPDWVFGNSTYAFLPDGQVVVAWSDAGAARLTVVGGDATTDVATPYTQLSGVRATDTGVITVAGSPLEPTAVVEIGVPDGRVSVLAVSRGTGVGAGYLSAPRPIEFPTVGGLTAHAWYYPPANPDFAGPDTERPPLVVMSHGGPTSAAQSTLNYGIQFWTSRGIAVVDVDYGGSAGYGRAYRRRLDGQWGIVDVDDCVNAARWLAERGEVDGGRLAIRGGSAGGYTTLCALTFRDVFAAGASLYGVADAGILAAETHKFESRYLDRLIGPWPEARAVYEERSPIFHTEDLRTPLIMFQGLEDRIVPPNQAEMMAAALRAKGVPHALVLYEGEQHGFRKAETITRTAEAELAFYGRVLGFTPAGPPVDLDIVNGEALPAQPSRS